MHVTVRYPEDSPTRERDACLDAAQYLGFRRMRYLARLRRYTTITAESFRMWAGFAGVHGYPATAMWDRFGEKSNG